MNVNCQCFINSKIIFCTRNTFCFAIFQSTLLRGLVMCLSSQHAPTRALAGVRTLARELPCGTRAVGKTIPVKLAGGDSVVNKTGYYKTGTNDAYISNITELSIYHIMIEIFKQPLFQF